MIKRFEAIKAQAEELSKLAGAGQSESDLRRSIEDISERILEELG